MGDVKMLAMIGAFLGWRAVLVTLVLASFSGALVGVALIAAQRGGMRVALPFGTFLAMGALAAMFTGDSLIAWYARHNLAGTLGRMGRIAEGVAMATVAAEESARSGHRRGESFAHVYIATFQLFAGNPKAAIVSAEAALRSAAPPVVPLAQATRARAHVLLGESDAALELAADAMKRMEELGASRKARRSSGSLGPKPSTRRAIASRREPRSGRRAIGCSSARRRSRTSDCAVRF